MNSINLHLLPFHYLLDFVMKIILESEFPGKSHDISKMSPDFTGNSRDITGRSYDSIKMSHDFAGDSRDFTGRSRD